MHRSKAASLKRQQTLKDKNNDKPPEDIDNDLMKALSEIPPMRLATIDEAFIVLDGGLGAIFSASMARRAAMNKKSKVVEKGPKKLQMNADSDGPAKKSAGVKFNKGRLLFQNAAEKILAPLLTQKAQQTTLNMLSDLAGPVGGSRLSSYGDRRQSVAANMAPSAPHSARSSFIGGPGMIMAVTDSSPASQFMRGSFLGSNPSLEDHGGEIIFEHGRMQALHYAEWLEDKHRLPEDPLVREWAKQHLDLDPCRLQGLENTVEFRERLGHQMLCWQTLRADKFDKRPATAPADMIVAATKAESEYSDDAEEDDEEDDDDGDSSPCSDSLSPMPMQTDGRMLSSPHPAKVNEKALSSSPHPAKTGGKSARSQLHSAPTSLHDSPGLPIPVCSSLNSSLRMPPDGFATAELSLFGLTHHLDAQRMRRSRAPTATADDAEEFAEKGQTADRRKAMASGVTAAYHHSSISHHTATAHHAVPPNKRPPARPPIRSRFGHPTAPGIPDAKPGTAPPRTLPFPSRLPSRGQARDPPPGVSLRMPPAFVEPHFEIDAADVGHTPELTYLRCCGVMGLIPCPAVWRNFGGDKGIIDASKRSLSDPDIAAVVDTAALLAEDGHELKALDLCQNSLTDRGMHHVASFMNNHHAACNKLAAISLAGNVGIRFVSADAVDSFSQALAALPALETLDLSCVPVHGQAVSKLCRSLEASMSLKDLNLAGCGLGRLDQTETIAAAALIDARLDGQAGLLTYDLSANFFGAAGFAAAAKALRGSKLNMLSFAGNSISSKGSASCNDQTRFHPIQLLVEGLQFNTSLENLNLDCCGLGPDSAFVLEDSLQGHPSLTSLALSDNPLGDDGIRCILRLVLSAGQLITACDVGNPREADATAHPIKFRYAQPAGIYHLNLRYPHERATLRTLVRKCDKESGFPFRYFKFEAKQTKPDVQKDPDTEMWVMPCQGEFGFSFHPPLSESAMAFAAAQLAERKTESPEMDRCPSPGPGSDRRGSTNSEMGYRRHGSTGSEFQGMVSPSPSAPRSSFSMGAGPASLLIGGLALSMSSISGSPRGSPRGSISDLPRILQRNLKADAFEADWSEVTMLLTEARMKVPALRYPLVRRMFLSLITVEQQLRFIHACSKDMAFNCPQIEKLCEDRPELATQILCSLFPSIRGRTPQLLLLGNCVAAHSPAVTAHVSRCLWFQEGNVTGRYNLDLQEPSDYAVAENCLIANAWESEVGKLMRWPDISQRGTYEMLRNEAHNEVKFDYTREWLLPHHGRLRFDFSSVRRPPSDVGVMSESAEVTRYLQRSNASNEAKLKALRAVSVHMYLTGQQFRNLMLCFPPEAGLFRQEIFCILHARVTDPLVLLSPDVFYSSTLLSNKDRISLLERIGPLHLLNPMHPERVWYRCNLGVYEQRQVIHFLVQLHSREPGGKIAGHGTTQYRHGPVPASWADKGVPDADQTIVCSYEAKHPNPAWRRELAAKFCVGKF